MAQKQSTQVKVGTRNLEVTNLGKTLFRTDAIVKAELIDYYVRMAPTLLNHIKGRPLSLVRFPDGIDGEAFFQKNRPESAPDWIDHELINDTDYIVATSPAAIVWLANLACIELHQAAARRPHLGVADYLVFDLDPPEATPFGAIVELALDVRALFERFGYRPYVKTTGGKGAHVLAPIEPKWSFDDVFTAAQALAKELVAEHASTTTLELRKNARRGKIFIDVLRNRPYQTIVCPYSVRGRPGAPVSLPLTWDEFEQLENPLEYSLLTVPKLMETREDPWDAIASHAVTLHTHKRPTRASTARKPAPRKSADLTTYARKRKFEATPEPPPARTRAGASRFVLHRHHASRIHYDLRLEMDGVLKSWAIPKGLPARPGEKHLAVATEDHPVRYLSFEGSIPKGQYGGGEMWIFSRGIYTVTVSKPDSFHIRLASDGVNAEYLMIHTKGDEWLIDRVDELQFDWLKDRVAPMLSESRTTAFDSVDWAFELKWDGIRALIAVDGRNITIRSRSGRDITAQFPEFAISDSVFRTTAALYDAEIVCLDNSGRPQFEWVLGRLNRRPSVGRTARGVRHTAVCYIFDCLYLDGRPIVGESWTTRRAWMRDSLRPNGIFRVSDDVPEGRDLFNAALGLGLEGIMAKRRDSVYVRGSRVDSWLKIKTRATADAVIVGYTDGAGDRDGTIGALHLGAYDGGNLVNIGKVGTGWSSSVLKQIGERLDRLPKTPPPFPTRSREDRNTTWVEPRLVCEVQYASLASTGHFREPVFLRLRPDIEPRDCAVTRDVSLKRRGK